MRHGVHSPCSRSNSTTKRSSSWRGPPVFRQWSSSDPGAGAARGYRGASPGGPRLRGDRCRSSVHGECRPQTREPWARRAACPARRGRGIVSDPVVDLKRELLAASDRLHGGPGSGPNRGDRGARRVLLLVGSLSVAAVAALLYTTPWTDGPNLVENARAALTPPAETILHVKWTMTTTSRRPACTITRGPSELWIDQTPPHRYRAVLRNEIPAVDPRLDLDPDPVACSRGTTTELGGTIDNVCSAKGCKPTLRFVPPNTLRVMPVGFRPPTDWAAMLRDALAAGRAHSAGKTRVRGRVVERLRLDPPPGCRPSRRDAPPGWRWSAERRPLSHVRALAQDGHEPRAHRHAGTTPDRKLDLVSVAPTSALHWSRARPVTRVRCRQTLSSWANPSSAECPRQESNLRTRFRKPRTPGCATRKSAAPT